MRVLVVEDERRLAAALKWGLESHSFTVDVVHDGRDGLWMAQEGDYAAIILDIMLPGLNGYRVCAALRRAGDSTPIMMLTAKDGEYDEVEGIETGADDYLTKPFSYPVLLARLRSMVRRGKAPPRTMTFGDLAVDPGARTCHRGDEPIKLTAREFGVLECLALRADRAVSKIEILEQVWDAHYDGDVNVVEVHVSALRRKIDQPYGRRAIVTVRGMGYLLDGRGG
ncbi:DNA-binding response OmpR family regulator [Herbihabitans rhizosphaerae]|uniref:DNA-binding response OmpR family regulator n=1 Tax=Herbihabitans rhizosphaerae TaxID=1872711 RepID=A0A4Q7L863_9PSEU|nr:response regulator transcription factor [Herbihabitans rhizosphaerae]RZS45110.1 DNA-binding response OmpR family regulator [Herbihabitans rhizosphaerae]